MKHMKKSLIIACLGLTAASCTKSVPYQTVDKNQVLAKSAVASQGQEYLMTVVAKQQSRNTNNGQPFSFGDNRRVYIQFTDTEMQIMEKDSDQRYEKAINDHLIATFPVKASAYDCKTDAYGECTGSEEEIGDKVDGADKAFFKLDKTADVKTGALQILPIMFDVDIGDPCFKQVSARITAANFEANAINIEVKRQYQQLCFSGPMEQGLSDTSINAVFQYSLVRTDSVLTPGFKTLAYDQSDEDTFGFFFTERPTHDVDNNELESQNIRIMNHWNPNRTTIDYWLSDEFDKPENSYVKDLTKEAIVRLNKGLAESGAKFQINLHDPAGKNPGDIRNSMIVLVDDPTQSGLLGYGPQTEDPKTGEIISARTIMFLAGFEQETHMLYDEVDRMLRDAANDAAQAAQAQQEQAQPAAPVQPAQSGDGSGTTGKGKLKVDAKLMTASLDSFNATVKRSQKLNKFKAPKTSNLISASGKAAFFDQIKNNKFRSDVYSKGDLQSYARYMREAKNCALAVGADGMSLGKVRPDLAAKIQATYGVKNSDGSRGRLMPWTSLDAGQRADLVKTIISEIWIPVVLHEMGHNMGLRHNFEGSEDKSNFYSPDELAAKNGGAALAYTIPYSSIMEYGDDLHSLPFLGKYDIAALRYGYARQVEVGATDKDGNVVGPVSLMTIDDSSAKDQSAQGIQNYQTLSIDNLKKTLKAQNMGLKSYKYCTDESVGANAGCHRFDEGSSYSEIADYIIQGYRDAYSRRYFRNDRPDFSSLDDATAYEGRIDRLMELRVMVELYERIKNDYGVADDDAAWTSNAFLKDLKTAALKAVHFYLEILKTPDQTCVLAKKDKPDTIVAVVPLSEIGGEQDNLSCFDINDLDSYVVLGEIGKSFNDKKSPNSINKYVDQIDVRGYYIDKLAAARMLFARTLPGFPSLNGNLDNAWDISDVHDELQSVVIGLLTNKLTTTQEVRLKDGSTDTLTTAYDYLGSHVIHELPDAGYRHSVASRLGIREANVYFAEALGDKIVHDSTSNAGNLAAGSDLRNLVSVRRVGQMDQSPSNAASLLTADIDGTTSAYAGASNLVAQDVIQDKLVMENLGQAQDDQKSGKRTAFNDLYKFVGAQLQTALTGGAHVGDIIQPKFKVEDVKAAAPSLTDDEADFVMTFAGKAGIDGLANKLVQMSKNKTLDPSDAAKILWSLPGI